MGKWKTISREILHEAPRFGNVVKEHIQMTNGYEIKEYIMNEYPDWVNAVVVTEDDEVVLVRQYRHAGGETFFEVPAGMGERGETQEEAIVREVKEETGYTSPHAPIYLGSFYTNPAVATNQVHSYLMTDAKDGVQTLDEGEQLSVQVCSWKEVENLQLTQMFSVLALLLVKQKIGAL